MNTRRPPVPLGSHAQDAAPPPPTDGVLGAKSVVGALSEPLPAPTPEDWLLQAPVSRAPEPPPPAPTPAPPRPAPPAPTPPPPPTYGITALSLPAIWAPSVDTVPVRYTLVDPAGAITTVRWELFATIDGQLQSVQVRALTGADATPGEHRLDWDGALPAGAAFPDGFLSIEHSPYRLDLSVAGGEPALQQARFEVKVAALSVTLADKACVIGLPAQNDDRVIWDQVGSLPASGLKKLYLKSDLYAASSPEMTTNAAFVAYRTLWGDGPRIPMIATVTVQAQDGRAVKAPKALGNARVLWDYTAPAFTHPGYGRPTVQAFVDLAHDYDPTAARPKHSVLAHRDRGGKRDRPGRVEPVFVAPDSRITLPFAVAPGATRRWAAFATIEKSGAYEAQAGAVFRPARTAGDRYTLKAWLSRDRALDTDDNTPTGALADCAIGEFEIWRRITLARHLRKCAAVTAPLPDIRGYYAEAFIDVDNRIGAVETLSRDDYDRRFAAARSAVAPGDVSVFLRESCLPDNASPYDGSAPAVGVGHVVRLFEDVGSAVGLGTAPTPTTWVMTIETYAVFRAKVQARHGFSNARLQNRLNAAQLGTEDDYLVRTRRYARDIATAMCKQAIEQDGITILQFDYTHNLEPAMSGRLNGNAVFSQRARTGFVIYNARQDTTGHEIGHCMFLPHAPRIDADDGVTLIDSGGGITPDRHDDNERNCLMSYARPREGFCGLCNLRLRGWDATAFDRDGPTRVK